MDYSSRFLSKYMQIFFFLIDCYIVAHSPFNLGSHIPQKEASYMGLTFSWLSVPFSWFLALFSSYLRPWLLFFISPVPDSDTFSLLRVLLLFYSPITNCIFYSPDLDTAGSNCFSDL